MKDALSVEGKVDVRCDRERAWDLFSRFSDVAALIPSVQDVEVEGENVHARVETRLGALPVSSRVTLRVIESRTYECLKAEGLSYLGETVKQQIAKDVKGVDEGSVGKLFLHLDLRPGETADTTAVIYTAEVSASGRLKRIYNAILKTKVPSMMEEFATNIRTALETEDVVEAAVTARAGTVEVAGAPPGAEATGTTSALANPRPGLWSRLGAWLRSLWLAIRGGAA